MKFRHRLAFFGAAVLLLAALPACRPGGGPKLLFIGIDALDWELLDALRAQGLMPNLDRLIREGAAAEINTDENADSALYWTNIATGQHSKKHGINGFAYKNPETGKMVINTSNRRKVKAFWNIFSEKKISVGVTGWFVTWPAEAVKGFMVSSYMAMRGLQPVLKGSFYAGAADMVYPPDLEGEAKTLSQKGEEYYRRDLLKIVPTSTQMKRRPKIIKAEWTVMSDLILREVGLGFYKKLRPMVLAVYFNGIDVLGHQFTNVESPENAKLLATFGDVQKNYYVYMDGMIKPLLDTADKNTTIIIVSDHGLMRGKHTDRGVFIMRGPNVKANARLETRVSLIDICPTMLYLMGLPVAEDMDGRVCTAAFTDEFLRTRRIRTTHTYGPRREYSSKTIESNFDDKIIERLKSLGYLK
jgi:predicted AlkP superfamily pyrophosphatase or phosphodiesterase